MNVIEIKKAVYNFLTTKTKFVYDTQAPSRVEYPYVVYTLDTTSTYLNEVREDFDLTIDVYDNNQFDSTALDMLIGRIDGDGAIKNATGLHRKHYYGSTTVQMDFYRTGRNAIIEENENIRHVELSYDVMSYLK